MLQPQFLQQFMLKVFLITWHSAMELEIGVPVAKTTRPPLSRIERTLMNMSKARCDSVSGIPAMRVIFVGQYKFWYRGRASCADD